MSSLFETLSQTLGSNALGQLSQQIGADHASTSTAVSAALPMLIGALATKASQPQGAADLHGALTRDHDGSILNDLQGYLGSAAAGADGSSILGHLLGDQRSTVEAAVGQSSGLGADSTAKLLELLAPIVMGQLGRTTTQQGLDPSALAGLLGQEHQGLSQSGMLSGLLANAASRFFGKAGA